MAKFKHLIVLLVCFAVSTQLNAGDLYLHATKFNRSQILFELFEKQNYSPEDVRDLDRIWQVYKFTENQVVDAFNAYNRHNPPVMNAYQEAILWHTNQDVVPSSTTKEQFEFIAQKFHEKAGLFSGTVRLIGGFLDDSAPNRKGFCRWIAPNTFVMLYVVRQARAPYLGEYFPRDGGTLVTQTLH